MFLILARQAWRDLSLPSYIKWSKEDIDKLEKIVMDKHKQYMEVIDRYAVWYLSKIYNMLGSTLTNINDEDYVLILTRYDKLRELGLLDGKTGKIRNFVDFDHLENFMDSMKDYIAKDYRKIAIDNGEAEIIYEKDNIWIVHIKSYEASFAFGRDAWCIVKYKEDYIDEDKNKNKFFFIMKNNRARYALNFYDNKYWNSENKKVALIPIVKKYPELLESPLKHQPRIQEYNSLKEIFDSDNYEQQKNIILFYIKNNKPIKKIKIPEDFSIRFIEDVLEENIVKYYVTILNNKSFSKEVQLHLINLYGEKVFFWNRKIKFKMSVWHYWVLKKASDIDINNFMFNIHKIYSGDKIVSKSNSEFVVVVTFRHPKIYEQSKDAYETYKRIIDANITHSKRIIFDKDILKKLIDYNPEVIYHFDISVFTDKSLLKTLWKKIENLNDEKLIGFARRFYRI